MIATESFQVNKLLIIGDLLIDETYRVKASKLSPEAPVPVVMKKTRQPSRTLGGAALAACYAAKNNIPYIFLTACSQATYNSIKEKINIIPLKVEEDIIKTRYIDDDSNYHLLRVDNDAISLYNPFTTEESIQNFKELFINTIKQNDIGMVVILDYCKGLLTNSNLNQFLIDQSHKTNLKVYVDTRAKDIQSFKNANFIKLNLKELDNAYKTLNVSNEQRLIDNLSCDTLIVTKGKDGAELYRKDKDYKIKYIPELSSYKGTPDVTGCGDVFDVTFCDKWNTNREHYLKILTHAVNKATEFAYELIEERIQCLQ